MDTTEWVVIFVGEIPNRALNSAEGEGRRYLIAAGSDSPENPLRKISWSELPGTRLLEGKTPTVVGMLVLPKGGRCLRLILDIPETLGEEGYPLAVRQRVVYELSQMDDI